MLPLPSPVQGIELEHLCVEETVYVKCRPSNLERLDYDIDHDRPVLGETEIIVANNDQHSLASDSNSDAIKDCMSPYPPVLRHSI